MWNQKTLGVGSDLVDNSVILSKDELKLVVVGLELLFLEKNNLSTLWDLNTDTGEALGLSNEGKNLGIEVDVQLVVVRMSDDEGGKKTCFCLLNFNNPSLAPFVLEVEQSVGDAVVGGDLLHWLLRFSRPQKFLREVFHWYGSAMEEVA